MSQTRARAETPEREGPDRLAAPRRGGRRAVAGLALALVLAVGAERPGEARERLVREYGSSSGLDARHVGRVVQDDDGFLWVGSRTQILRFDGRDFVAVNREPLTRYPEGLVLDDLDGLLFVDLGEPFRLDAAGRRHPYEPPVEPPLARITMVARSARSSLWIADRHGLRHRDGGGRWTTIPHERFGDPVHWLHPVDERVSLAWGWRTLWRVTTDGQLSMLYEPRQSMTRATLTAEGRLFVTELDDGRTRLVEVVDGVARELFNRDLGTPHEIVARGRAVWVSTDRGLARWHPDDGVETFGPEDRIFGQLRLLDDEGSLWIAGPGGLRQLPEPRTVAWTAADGLPQTQATFVVRQGSGLYTSHYGGQGLISTNGPGAPARTVYRGLSFTPGCRVPDGLLKMAAPRDLVTGGFALVGVSDRGVSVVPRTRSSRADACTEANDGGAWVALGGALHEARSTGAPLEHVIDLPPADSTTFWIEQTRSGDVWITRHDEVCHVSASALDAGDAQGWSCETTGELHSILQVLETPRGEIWIRAFQGMFRRHAGGWQPLPGFPPGVTGWAAPSPRGGFWIENNQLGLVRVEESGPGDEYAVRVVEKLGTSSGLLLDQGYVHEDADGTLWIASSVGIQQVPASARDLRVRVPRVAFVSGRSSAGAFPGTGEIIELRPHDDDVELVFAALTYKDRAGLRFRTRVRDGDPWRETRLPELRFVDLAPGRYDVTVQASLDGVAWSERPATVAFRLLPPWYRTWWASLLFVALLAVALYGLYRARVAVLLRLERQRTRIAMDLHDEVGSGLGSIGVLSGLLTRGDLDGTSTASIATQIETSARELASALSDIVWSLRPRAHTLAAVMQRLETRANQLLPDADVRVMQPAALSGVPVSLPVCKTLLSIGSEALHNAARHGRPSVVELALGDGRGGWSLTIRDDGRGFDPDGPDPDGLGLASMRRRAGEIGGALAIRSRPGAGTEVRLEFDARAGDRRIGTVPHRRAGARRAGVPDDDPGGRR